jgi:hypothetical protein
MFLIRLQDDCAVVAGAAEEVFDVLNTHLRLCKYRIFICEHFIFLFANVLKQLIL